MGEARQQEYINLKEFVLFPFERIPASDQVLLIDNNNLRNQLSVNAKESSKKFDKQIIMQQWDSLFKNLVNQ